MDLPRITDISNRIAIRGLLTLQDLIELQNAGADLTNYVDKNEVSKGNVSYDKYLTLLRAKGEGIVSGKNN